MPEFATLNSKFSYISIVKSKVPWVDKLFPDIKSKLKRILKFLRTFMPFMFKIAKVSAFHKTHGVPTGPGNNVRKLLTAICYKKDLGWEDLTFSSTQYRGPFT